MEILWVNHASFVIESKGIRLLADPWIAGTAFNDSWELLVPSRFETKDFDGITHIWFSHEHPDHFAPPVLNKIPEETRRRITVLYQKTRDQRVVDFCRKLGFTIRELRENEPIELSQDFRVTCGKVPFYDSWLACQAEGIRLLDLNDCVLESRQQLRKIRNRFGPIDVLLSQFSYASWFGNADQPERWREVASIMSDQLLREIAEVTPRFTVPCASFIRFCHVENQHMNLHANQIADIAARIEKQGVSIPIVLYPGDRWTVGSTHDNEPAIEHYRRATAASYSFRKSDGVPLEEIMALSRKYREKMLDKNDRAAVILASSLGFLPPVSFHVSDLNVDLRFDWRHGLNITQQRGLPDISLRSDSLAYLFRFDWGLDTLQVGGRFSASKPGFRRLICTFSLGSLNNMGLRFGARLATDPRFMQRAIIKVIRAR